MVISSVQSISPPKRKRRGDALGESLRREIAPLHLDLQRQGEGTPPALPKKVLWLGMVRRNGFDSLSSIEEQARQCWEGDNHLRDTARCHAIETSGEYLAYCVSKAPTTMAVKGSSQDSFTAHPRMLWGDMTVKGRGCRSFLTALKNEWQGLEFDYIILDHYWLPDSESWLRTGYFANDSGLIDNLVAMAEQGWLSRTCQVILPFNRNILHLLVGGGGPTSPLGKLASTFQVYPLAGTINQVRARHPALSHCDPYISEEVMSGAYGKDRDNQTLLLGVRGGAASTQALKHLAELVPECQGNLEDVRLVALLHVKVSAILEAPSHFSVASLSRFLVFRLRGERGKKSIRRSLD
ncbi:unnamed protein product [Chrysoparadoxa australica]